jgi:hypothetical protein
MAKINGLEKELNNLQILGLEVGQVIYNICFRNAGVGIQWHKSVEYPVKPMLVIDNVRTGNDSWKQGLYVEKYYPTLTEAIIEETKRLKNLIK